jgi:response regulator RpfG family c-di-GMP phosphodiesterase
MSESEDPHGHAADVIKNDNGSHFDPYLVEIFKWNEGKFAEVKYK